MHKISIVLCLLTWSISSFGVEIKTELNVTNIPDSLKTNAYAVVRNATTIYDYKSATSAIEKNLEIITVLDKKGESNSYFNYSGDKFRSLSSFSAKMYDATGKFLKKYGLSDVGSTEWSASLAEDARHYYFSCDPPSYPFTIVYEYEVKWKNGLLTFSPFVPQGNYNLSVEKASYQLLLPTNTAFRYKAIHLEAKPTVTILKDVTSREWSVKGLRAIEQEAFDSSLDAYIPILFNCAQDFIYDEVPGSITDWKTYGKWVYNLIQNRDVLPETTKTKLLEMTKNAKTDREKVKILYDYLGETTHYVSIQLGIGGYQPMEASEVEKTNFGDCKALSNYLKAMLKTIGISSNYCVIKWDDYQKKVYADYPNFNQFNHVILQVPLPNDTLWLECTNPRNPFGFVHNGIAGHDVIVCTPEGGQLTQTPDYSDSLNISRRKTIIEINPEGGAKVNSQLQNFAKIYDKNHGFPFYKASEQTDFLRDDINLPNVTMGTFQFKEDKSPLPSLTIENNWTTDQYGTKTGNRLFIPVNPFQSAYYKNIKKSKRIHNLERSSGYKDIDSICVRIPEGFEIEAIPPSGNLSTPFGTFQSVLTSNEKEIIIRQNAFFPTGKYDVSSYPAFIEFYEKIRSAYNGKIILRKKVS